MNQYFMRALKHMICLSLLGLGISVGTAWISAIFVVFPEEEWFPPTGMIERSGDAFFEITWKDLGATRIALTRIDKAIETIPSNIQVIRDLPGCINLSEIPFT